MRGSVAGASVRTTAEAIYGSAKKQRKLLFLLKYLFAQQICSLVTVYHSVINLYKNENCRKTAKTRALKSKSNYIRRGERDRQK